MEHLTPHTRLVLPATHPVAMDPAPILLVRRGAVSMHDLLELFQDGRLEVFHAHSLSPEWTAFARRASATLVADDNPLDALVYATTAGTGGPVLVVLAKGQEHLRDDLLRAGAADCVTLPLSLSDVDRIVSLSRTRGTHSRVHQSLRLLLDPIGRTVRYHDKAARLSQREFAVLHCLSSSEGRPVSAVDLLTSVWGDADSAAKGREILEVYVSHLRKKLDGIGLHGAIKTIRSFGYLLASDANCKDAAPRHSTNL